jgi:hypothetical protein
MKTILAATLALCLCSACDNTLDENGDERVTYEEEYSETVSLSGQTKLVLQDTNGEVDIVGSDTATAVYLEITKWVRSRSLQDAQQHIDSIVVTDETRPTEIFVGVEHPSSTERTYGVDFAIVVPEQFDFEIVSGNGSVSLHSTVGNSLLSVGNGEIELEDVEATQITAIVGNGSMDADATLMDTCSVDFAVGNGQIVLTIPGTTNAEVEASVGNGEITYSGLTFQNLQVLTGYLRGTLGDGSGTIVLQVGNGSIELTGN